MGVDYTCYVGPYIMVHNSEIDSIIEYHSCKNLECENNAERLPDKFCPKCGTKVELLKFPHRTKIDFDVYTEFKDRLATAVDQYKPDAFEDFDFYIPNTKNAPGRQFDATYSGNVIALNTEFINQELAKFSTMFHTEINKFISTFGEKNVTVKFGVLTWAW